MIKVWPHILPIMVVTRQREQVLVEGDKQQEDMQHSSELSDYREASGMEPDDNWWEGLVHPLQLYCISQASREVINLPQLDIKGELGGKLGMQQQHGTLQETWGESRWEEIVCRPQQTRGDPVTPLTQHCTHQEQRQRDAQLAGQCQNKTTPSTLVRRNLASFILGAAVCRAEFIPTEAQIRAAMTLDARALMSTTAMGGGILRNSSGDLCNKNKGGGDGSGALERLAERGPQIHTGGKRR
jgi:hypothetical protein